MIMKVMASDYNRSETIKKLICALEETTIEGIRHNISYQRALLKSSEFHEGKINTKWIENTFHARYQEKNNAKAV